MVVIKSELHYPLNDLKNKINGLFNRSREKKKEEKNSPEESVLVFLEKDTCVS